MDSMKNLTLTTNGAVAHQYDLTEIKNIFTQLYGKTTRGDSSLQRTLEMLDQFPTNQLATAWLIAFHTRSVRDGKGERALFYTIFSYLALRCHQTGLALLEEIPEYGYWKDLNQMYTIWIGDHRYARFQHKIVQMYVDQLENNYSTAVRFLHIHAQDPTVKLSTFGRISLASKWAPRLGSEFKQLAFQIMNHFSNEYLNTLADGKFRVTDEKTVPKEGRSIRRQKAYRHILATISTAVPTVEKLLCGIGQGNVSEDEIDRRFTDCGWIPSCALANLKNALRCKTKKGKDRQNMSYLREHLAELYNAHLENVVKGVGNAKVNGGSCQDTSLAKYMSNGPRDTTSELQMTSKIASILTDDEDLLKAVTLTDVSGSMTTPAGKSGVSCMDLAIYLCYMVSHMSVKEWRGRTITFETNPSWVDFSDCKTHYEAGQRIKSASWGGSTNFEKALDLVLQMAIQHNIQPEEMPELFFVFSDMQFDTANSGCGSWHTTHQRMVAQWANAGRTLPTIVYWNLNSNTPGCVVEPSTPGTIMVSGYSPALLKQIMSGNYGTVNEAKAPAAHAIDPYTAMMDALNSDAFLSLRQRMEKVQDKLVEQGLEPELDLAGFNCSPVPVPVE
jgi:hypothetical protein